MMTGVILSSPYRINVPLSSRDKCIFDQIQGLVQRQGCDSVLKSNHMIMLDHGGKDIDPGFELRQVPAWDHCALSPSSYSP